MIRSLVTTGIAVLALGCGTNRPDIPDHLLQSGSGGGPANYPAGPYGKDVGDVVENFTFTSGWLNPVAANHDPAQFAPISFADFHDPAGTQAELILLNTAAVWCVACKIEHGGSSSSKNLNEHFDELSPKGLRLLSLLFQDAKGDPATAAHLVSWTQAYETRFPMALDPEYQMGRFGPANQAPLNILVDARTMKIMAATSGDPSTLWPQIEAELDARASQ